jgi:hypothetical protein
MPFEPQPRRDGLHFAGVPPPGGGTPFHFAQAAFFASELLEC